eukprot:scaffold567_cov384-Prasinococcus_capsulatus_cf.AAC.4
MDTLNLWHYTKKCSPGHDHAIGRRGSTLLKHSKSWAGPSSWYSSAPEKIGDVWSLRAHA